MRKRTAIRAALGTALAVAGSLFVLPSAAQAVYTCQKGEVCIFSDHGLRGTTLVVYSGKHNFTSNWHFYNGLAANDNASSIVNKTDITVFVSSDFNDLGKVAVVWPGTKMEFTGQNGSLDDNTMSSINVYA
ncbi:hypothetical protein GCM10010435_39990 [Winogradskya consettensis]|uniref:Peptidase inhibitor family I36 n=1 Tax=Winogradskya consettensis TaxID=113560 RepID=A0A919SDF8_9ACTN|nr:peptidase inhibitor family I36 protein [Actinoplanes consettensis]GIM69614.1 hypothetical protein Aco04nite_16120 [Actinoplanes consettensis]